MKFPLTIFFFKKSHMEALHSLNHLNFVEIKEQFFFSEILHTLFIDYLFSSISYLKDELQ